MPGDLRLSESRDNPLSLGLVPEWMDRSGGGNTSGMSKTVQPGDMLPTRKLHPFGDGSPVRIGSNRPRAHVLVVTHAETCEECSRYLDSFEEVADSIRAEKADVLALVGDGWEERAPSLPVPVAVADGATRQMLSPEDTPVVAIVDRFGQVFSRVDAGADHSFPQHDKLLSGLIDLGIRCPECGVPDVPSPGLLPEEGTRSGGMMLSQ